MNKNLLHWIIAIVLGSLIASLGPSFFIYPSKYLSVKVPWYVIKFAVYASNIIVLHIILSGEMIKKPIYSILFFTPEFITSMFLFLSWSYVHIVMSYGMLLMILVYLTYYLKKRPLSNIDTFILFYILSLGFARFYNMFVSSSDKYTTVFYLIASLQLLPIIILHISNQLKKIKT